MARTANLGPLIETAYLLDQGLPQTDVARLLNLSQPAVARRLQAAIDARIAYPPRVVPPRLNRQNLDDDEYRAVAARWTHSTLAASLLTGLGALPPTDPEHPVVLRRLLVPKVGAVAPPRRTGPKATPDLGHITPEHRAIARAAAPRVLELLSRGMTVGTLPGRTLRALAKQVRDFAPTQAPQVSFVPLTGFPFFVEATYPVEITATAVAKDLTRALGGNPRTVPHLNAIPVFVPMKFTRKKSSTESVLVTETILDMFRHMKEYNRVFGPTAPAPDVILTSVGGVTDDAPWIRWLMEENERPKNLDRIAAGEIGLTLVPRPGLSGAARATLQEIEARSLGIGLVGFRACAARADRPGVVLIAHGPAKAEVVRYAVQAGCVTELIVDHALAQALAADLARPQAAHWPLKKP